LTIKKARIGKKKNESVRKWLLNTKTAFFCSSKKNLGKNGEKMVFEYKNSKGKMYYLHQNGKLFYFSGEKKSNAIDLPTGYKIIENNKTGLPMLRKK
jgi:ribosomal protein L24E